jgi:hypothetical protein
MHFTPRRLRLGCERTLAGRRMTIEEYKKVLARGHLYRSVYHFTARENLPSIRQHGIVSKAAARQSKIEVAVYGGNEWSHDADDHKGLNNYVNLCFTQSHPMCHLAHLEGRLKSPIYLAIDPEVLNAPGVRITLGVANKSGVELHDVETGLGLLDKEVLYTRTDWNDPSIQERLRIAEKCEILVPDRIPFELIKTRF